MSAAATIEATRLTRATLPELRRIANREHALVLRFARSMVEHAIRAGEALQTVKDQLAHGEWGSWRQANFDGSERTAQVYMELARHPQRAAVLEEPSISSALRAIRDREGRARGGSLRDEFVEPPFSTLDRRSGHWQKRRRDWLALGIRSEVGRTANLLNYSDTLRNGHGPDPGTSVFDPVVSELAYRWWCKPGGRVLDPFCGGSVRGVVAAALGLAYLGVDLSERQIAANREQAATILSNQESFPCKPPKPRWVVGDSQELAAHLAGEPPADLVFTSPPYGDLERYSDDPRDLSTMPYPQFREALGQVIAAAIGALANDRFAAIVVGDIRDDKGLYRWLVGDTVAAFEAAGAHLYNQAVIVDPTGLAAMRARKLFGSNRKLTTCHQHLMTFVRGDPGRAAAAIRDAGDGDGTTG